MLPRRCRSLRVGCSLRVVAAHSIAVSVERSHFAVGLFLGCVVFLQVAWLTTVKSPVQYSLEFRLRLEISEPYLAGRPQPASTSHGLSLPTPHTGSEGPLHAGMPARFGPSSGFGYPLDGLRPSWSSPVLFRTGSALGIRPSELSPRERLPGHYHPKGPTCRFSCRFSHHTRQRAGPTGRGFWVLTARESLTAEQRFNLPTAGCSLGILAPTRS